MREIKFRSWNCQVMYQMKALLIDDRKYPQIKEAKDIIMQYIGLKDKNGKEIYEGDIVRWDDKSNGVYWRVAEVLINPDIQFKIVTINCDFVQSSREGYIFEFVNFMYKDTENHLEIIGNIYENSELLSK